MEAGIVVLLSLNLLEQYARSRWSIYECRTNDSSWTFPSDLILLGLLSELISEGEIIKPALSRAAEQSGALVPDRIPELQFPYLPSGGDSTCVHPALVGRPVEILQV